MTTDWLMSLQRVGSAIYAVFMLPGDFLLAKFATHAPALALSLGIDANSDVALLSAILSLSIWLLMAGVIWKSFRLLQNIARRVTTACRSIVFRTSLRIRNAKTSIRCGLLKLLPRRRTGDTNSNPELEFDDIDLAVLRNSAATGGGFVVSAPGLAAQLTLRPSQTQRSLERLGKYRMVESVLGSTDGFNNYRLTPSGAAFLAALERSGNRDQPLTATSIMK